MPSADERGRIIAWLAKHPPAISDIAAIIEAIVADFDGALSSESAKLATIALVSANAFVCEPQGVTLAEQKLTLKADMRAESALSTLLLKATRHKLATMLDQVDDDILRQLIGGPVQPAGAEPSHPA